MLKIELTMGYKDFFIKNPYFLEILPVINIISYFRLIMYLFGKNIIKGIEAQQTNMLNSNMVLPGISFN